MEWQAKMVTTVARMTVEEFERWRPPPEKEHCRFDLWDGEVIEMAPAGDEHGAVAAKIGRLIGSYADELRLGRTYAAETGFALDVERPQVLAPDAAFVVRARLTAGRRRGFFPGAPDLAVEVQSPDQSRRMLAQKAEAYLAAGSRLVWIVDLDHEQIIEYRPGQPPQTLGADDLLAGHDVLPGFRALVRTIFAV